MLGSTVARTQVFERAGRRYVGGVTYSVFDAQADELVAARRRERLAADPSKNARRAPGGLGSSAGDFLLEVTHGSAIVQVTYTLRVHREGNVVRFWMDPARPHDIEDAWGFFRSIPSTADEPW